MQSSRNIIAAFLTLACAACTAGELSPRDGTALAGAPARLIVYWPAETNVARNAERPEVALNNRRIGAFAAGSEIGQEGLTPGLYRLAIRRPAANAPNKEIGVFDLMLEPGQTLYVRYSDEPFGSGSPAPVESFSARVRIAIVDEATGIARR